MVKIKQKKTMNLPQLIEWAWDNVVIYKNLLSDNATPLRINIGGDFIFNNDYVYSKNDTFTVEVEEELTEDTVIPKMLILDNDGSTRLKENHRTSYYRAIDTKALYLINDDLTLDLIWRDGILIEE